MRLRLISAVIAACGLMTTVGAQTPNAPQPRANPTPLRPQPPPPTPEQREATGLAEPTWTAQGKVDPAVREEFENQRKREEEAGGMADYVPDYHPYRPVGFRGMVYVAVYLRNGETGSWEAQTSEPTIKRLQQQVLSRLTAAEFALRHTFGNHPAMLGYVNSDGLAKLERDADVLAVGLDHNPPPVRPPEYRQGPPIDPSRWDENGKVDPEIAQRLQASADGVVFVSVATTSVGLSPGDENDLSAMRKRSIQWHAANREIHDRVLSTLSADELRMGSRTVGRIAGFVSAAGLAKLGRHPDVLMVGLDSLGKTQGAVRAKGRR